MGRAATSSTRLACRERLVSPLVASPTEQDRVRELQRALYRAAKADPRRRFHALYDKLSRRDVLERAWGQVRANRGAAGIDRITLADVEQYGSVRLLDELAADLRDGRYRPLPARRVFIPKPGSQERRPLLIPAIRDRIVQAAAKTVIEPIFEAGFQPCSFGFRPRRRAHDALQVLLDESFRADEAPWVCWRLGYLADTLPPRPASAPHCSAGWPASTGAKRRTCSLKFASYSTGGRSPSSSWRRSSL